MGMVDRVTDIAEYLEPLPRGQTMTVAIFRNGDSAHVLHREIRHAALGRAGIIQHARDIWMIHHRQRLAFGFEARNDFPAV